ncbi:MAG: ribbon-helix-helix protein, CopG family [Candidatus Aenigmatarchaeota archaeon]
MKVRATFLIDKDLLKKFKTKAISEEKSYSELLEELIKKKLNEK